MVVIDREDTSGIKYLCAYFSSKEKIPIEKLRAHLASYLPSYMIPSFFVQMEMMPFNPNGKIDRKALPEPEGSMVLSTKYEPPRNSIEEKLVELWAEVLLTEKESIGIHHNFFELGGHSLRATLLSSRIHKHFNVSIPLREIFDNPSIEKITHLITNRRESIYKSIRPVEKRK